MKKNLHRYAALIVILFLALLSLAAAAIYPNAARSTFTGSRIKNEDSYSVDCRVLNGEDTHTLTLQEGDVLSVRVQVEKGTLAVSVAMEGQTPLYRSSGIETSTFTLTVPVSGDYTVSLTGRDFAGQAVFTRALPSNADDFTVSE